MSGDVSSSQSSAIPFPTLTIIYIPFEAEIVIDEISNKYNNITAEDCDGYFIEGKKKKWKKITIWSQGIDSLWFNAVIARIKEISDLTSVPIVTGGVMYTV